MIISVIIPLYNSEKYIKKCTDSLVKSDVDQNDIEFIFVDDESTDNSIDILKSYGDPRIKIIKKKHSNVYDAWKLGLKHSRGEYIMGVDSDDFVDSKLFRTILNTLGKQSPDLIMFNYKQYFSKGNKERISKNMIRFKDGLYLKDSDDFAKLTTPDFEHPCCLYTRWNKAIKRNKLLQIFNGSKMCDELCKNMFEDVKIMTLIFKIVDSILFINKSYYFYRVRDDSTTHEKSKIEIELAEAKNLTRFLEINKELFNLSEDYLNKIYLYRYALLYLRSIKLKCNEITDFIWSNNKYKSLLKKYHFKNKLLGFMMKKNMKRELGFALSILK